MTTSVPKGLEGVVAATTQISHVDGLAGELIIVGYRLDEIAGRATLEGIAFVVWQLATGHGAALPNRAEYETLTSGLAELRNQSRSADGCAAHGAGADVARRSGRDGRIGRRQLSPRADADSTCTDDHCRARSAASRPGTDRAVAAVGSSGQFPVHDHRPNARPESAALCCRRPARVDSQQSHPYNPARNHCLWTSRNDALSECQVN